MRKERIPAKRHKIHEKKCKAIIFSLVLTLALLINVLKHLKSVDRFTMAMLLVKQFTKIH